MAWLSSIAAAIAPPPLMTTLLPGPPSRTSWPAAADQDVVAGAAEQRVVAGAADQDVVAVAAVGRELRCRRRRPEAVDDVVAAQGVDRHPVVGRLGAGDVDLGGEPGHRDDAVVAGDRDHVVAAGAVDDDGVRLAVAVPLPGAGEVEVDLVDVGAGQVVDGDGVGAAEGVEVDRARRR